MPDIQEVLSGPFDIQTHRRTFCHYLEVCIDPEGVAHYANPSHQRWLLERFLEARGFVDDLEAWPYVPAAGPTDWLCEETGCVAVWERGILGTPNAAQRSTLRELKLAGLYLGPC